jgi:hypothetical protein
MKMTQRPDPHEVLCPAFGGASSTGTEIQDPYVSPCDLLLKVP